MAIRYLVGDATNPPATGRTRIIAHICNDEGRWGSGFVLAVSARWADPEALYRSQTEQTLGTNQYQEVEPDLLVANMIAQHGCLKPGETPRQFVDYRAVEDCLRHLAAAARYKDAEIHMPRIGAGLGGGDWKIIEPLINKTLAGLDVTVWDLPK